MAFVDSLAWQDTTGASSKDYGTLAAPLTNLLRKNAFLWTEAADAAFAALKTALSAAPVLHLPDFDNEFFVDCDASGSGFGAVLHQGAGPVAFFSRPFAARHLKVAAYERELIGLVQAVPSLSAPITTP